MSDVPDPAGGRSRDIWAFMTNHAHVLVCIADDPHIRLRDVAVRVGITERAAQSIVADLVGAGFVTRFKVGRRNRYEIHGDRPLRHEIEANQSVGGLVEFLRGTVMTREYAYSANGAVAPSHGNGNGHAKHAGNGNGHAGTARGDSPQN
jgi:hypothetical protein